MDRITEVNLLTFSHGLHLCSCLYLFAACDTWISIDTYLFVKEQLKKSYRHNVEGDKGNMKEHVYRFDLDKVQLHDDLPNPQKGVREDEKTNKRKADRSCLEKVINMFALSLVG